MIIPILKITYHWIRYRRKRQICRIWPDLSPDDRMALLDIARRLRDRKDAP